MDLTSNKILISYELHKRDGQAENPLIRAQNTSRYGGPLEMDA